MIHLQQVVVDDPLFRPGTLDCARVGLLTMEGSNRFGHCIRLTEDWILTAHHVLDVPELASRFRAGRFGYLEEKDSPGFSYALDPEAGYFCSNDGIRGRSGDGFDLDYAFVRLAGPFQLNDATCERPLKVSDYPPIAGSRAHIPQFNTYPVTIGDRQGSSSGGAQNAAVPDHMAPVKVEDTDPGSRLLPNCEAEPFPYSIESLLRKRHSVRRAGTFVGGDDPYLYHLAHTEDGCSGAPIFNDRWELIGLHTHGWWCGNHDDGRKLNNWGTSLACIVRDAARRGFDFGNIPVLEPLVPPRLLPGRRNHCEPGNSAAA